MAQSLTFQLLGGKEIFVSDPSGKLFDSSLLCLAAILAVVSLVSILRHDNLMNYALRGDFYPRWYGTKEAFLHGRDPYSPEVTREIQVAYYGHAARREHEEEQPFAFYYPAYVIFLVWPTMWMDFGSVRLLVSTVLLLSLLATLFCWMKIAVLKSSWRLRVAVLLLAVSSVPAVQGILLQQLALAVVMLMAAGILAITSGRLGLAGALFALATIKPPTAIFTILWLILWAFSRWHERWRFILGFLVTLATLIALSELIVPGWLSAFIGSLIAYNRYSSASPILVVMLGKAAGTLAILAIFCAVAALGFKYRAAAIDDPAFLFMVALVQSAAILSIPSLAGPYNQVLLLPAVFLLLREGPKIARWALIAFTSLLILPSILATIIRLQGVDKLLILPVVMSLALPIITFTMVLTHRRILTQTTTAG